MYASRTRVVQLKWGLVILIGIINVSGYVVWIPAKMEINDQWVRVNVGAY